MTMYLYSEEGADRPTVSTTLSRLANYEKNEDNETTQDENDGKIGSVKAQLSKTGSKTQAKGAELGTITGVFLPCIQNIFGVIIFIRMLHIVGTAGVPAAFVIVFICCSVTFATSISLSAIATNGIVPAGGSYFMISRALGPEFGGAVGILFFLATAVAGAMYITGAVEILLNYISPSISLFGDFRKDNDILYHNIRLYGTVLLILCSLIVWVGVKFVSKVAPIALVCVLLSILSIYFGIFINFEGTQDTYCRLGNRIIANDGNLTCSKNISDPNSYFHQYCIWVEQNGTRNLPSQSRNKLAGVNYNYNPLNPKSKGAWACDPYFETHDLTLQRSVPGIASGVIKDNLPLRFNTKGNIVTLDEDSSYPPDAPKYRNIFVDITTTFTNFVAVYFPSCTGILAGSNRSGDLADAQKSIPTGTIAAQLVTSFVYLSSVVLFGAAFDNLFSRDKFGECANGQLAVTLIAWPYPFLIVLGALLSTLGAALQSLTSAPRLLQAITKDELIPVLNFFNKIDSRGEPVRALLATMAIAWLAILIGNLDFIAPILTMFFLMCYMFVNLACTLMSILRTPNWRPRFKYYHWSLSLTGVSLCLFVMFISSWIYAIAAISVAGCIYKYIEWTGAQKEWGDGFDGLQLSAARYALLRLEDKPAHTKNWRPQILVLTKLKHDHSAKHRKLLSFAAQLKAGKGLTVVSTCLEGGFNAQSYCEKESARRSIHKQMNDEKVKGFCQVLVTRKVSDGCSSLIQTAGLGGLRHNTVIVGWPCGWNSNPTKVTQFMKIVKTVALNRNALLIPRGIDNWPETGDKMGGNIDVWWIVHDGGLLMLIPFLLKQHKTWKNCHLRIFTVAEMSDNSVQMKRDLQQWIYALRIEARSLEVIELNENDISEYTYERTVKMEQRSGQLRQLFLRNEKEASGLQNTALLQQQFKAASQEYLNQIDGKDSMELKNKKNSPECPKLNLQEATPQQSPILDEKRNSINQKNDQSRQSTPSPNSKMLNKPDDLNVKRMNTAIKLNEAITSKSSTSKLVIINLPGLPKNMDNEIECNHYLEFVDVLCEGLERVVLVRGSGREVITIYS